MKFSAGERMKVRPAGSKKIQGLSGAKSQKVGGAKIPENVRWSRPRGYSVKFGKTKSFAVAAEGLPVVNRMSGWSE